ncbi:MAG: hypothetical protein M0R68_08470, partial [Bacteroidetes bacterium]|nr:hypothetical protein [Bacteroidota bacterium]
ECKKNVAGAIAYERLQCCFIDFKFQFKGYFHEDVLNVVYNFASLRSHGCSAEKRADNRPTGAKSVKENDPGGKARTNDTSRL